MQGNLHRSDTRSTCQSIILTALMFCSRFCHDKLFKKVLYVLCTIYMILTIDAKLRYAPDACPVRFFNSRSISFPPLPSSSYGLTSSHSNPPLFAASKRSSQLVTSPSPSNNAFMIDSLTGRRLPNPLFIWPTGSRDWRPEYVQSFRRK